VCEVCIFVEVFQFAKTSANSRKNKKTIATWQFFTFFWGNTLIYIVYVACPGDDAD
jgi:hypothetical protein